MNLHDKILVLGSRGMVGSAIVRELKNQKYTQILHPLRNELNLLDQAAVDEYFKRHKPRHVFLAAARVGGIIANNTFRADFIFENLQIQTNAFKAAFENEVEKFLFLGSSCIYPKMCPQPINEDNLLKGAIEPTNEPYAIAKIAGLKMAENFRRQYGKKYYTIIPAGLFGENDNYHPENSHVIPGLIQRMHKTISEDIKTFDIWGDGTPKREFLYVDDLAKACLFTMNYNGEKGELPYWFNAGAGTDIMIKDLAKMIGDIMGYKGDYLFNTDKPNGTPQKLLDSSVINKLGWRSETSLQDGLKKAIGFYLASQK